MALVSIGTDSQVGLRRRLGKHAGRSPISTLTLLWCALLLLGSYPASAQVARPDACATPPAKEDGWQVADPAAAGFDPSVLCAIGPRFAAWTEANLHAVLVIRRGQLAYERYFAGRDEQWGRPLGVVAYDTVTKHDLRSITKSVISLILGIAIGKGQIADIDQPVLPMFPEYADLRSPEKDLITLRHLVTMSQGLSWNEDMPYSDPDNSETQMNSTPDPVRYVLSRPVAFPPGVVFTYSGGFAALPRKATGQPIDVLARETLFAPLGITDVEWNRLVSGEPPAASGLRLRPRDTAKIGQLILDHGRWAGNQIVPEKWITAATASRINASQLWFYGYQFWLGRSLVGERQVEWIEARGYGGQRLYIVPVLELVVLIHAGLYRSALQGVVPMMVLNRYVLRALAAP